MKQFLVQPLWFIAIFVALTAVIGMMLVVLFPQADPTAMGEQAFIPILGLSLLATILGSRTGKLPGTKRKS